MALQKSTFGSTKMFHWFNKENMAGLAKKIQAVPTKSTSGPTKKCTAGSTKKVQLVQQKKKYGCFHKKYD